MSEAQAFEPLQADLLQGLLAPPETQPPQQALGGGQEFASSKPVARIYIDSNLPQIDRLFDYLVPAQLDEAARPGVRVRVTFHGAQVTGWIRERVETSDSAVRLLPIRELISPLSLVSPEVFELAEALAQRTASLVSDTLRLALPQRVVSAEAPYILRPSKEAQPLEAPLPEPDQDFEPKPDFSAFDSYQNGPEFCQDLLEGAAARAVMMALPDHRGRGWEHLLATVLVATASTGRGALAVVPDYKSLDRLQEALEKLVPRKSFARLTSQDSPSDRYQEFLRVRRGQVRIVIGTRSAAYAPLANLGLVACWDDSDSNLVERKAPYSQIRDVLLVRAEQAGAAALLMAYTVSSESVRLLRTGWASFIAADRAQIRAATPRIMPTGDDYQLARDPLAALARIPSLAFETAQSALKEGPVLIQVARAGYLPALSCQRCYMPARCSLCRGPLGLPRGESLPQCGWCGHLVSVWACQDCGYDRWRTSLPGALRTAEELGKSFPGVQVISSSGENVKTRVGPEPALVVATPGAEPQAEGGYVAALLLDADRMLFFDSLRAPETALRRWLNAAALVRPFHQGGRVVITASQSAALEALIRWDPARFALWELGEREELGLPPAVRTAALTGSQRGVELFLSQLKLEDSVRVSGPVALADPEGFYEGEESDLYRAILFFSYGQAASVTRQLRAVRASLAAKNMGEPIQIRCDGLDIL